jgi:hypothetical protein
MTRALAVQGGILGVGSTGATPAVALRLTA